MAIYKNTTELSKVYKGASELSAVYFGVDKIFPILEYIIEFLVIAGGGGGNAGGGGGGAGGYLNSFSTENSGQNSPTLTPIIPTLGNVYSVNIGAGGVKSSQSSSDANTTGTAGGNSSLSGAPTAIGGGCGTYTVNRAANNGGSGGGSVFANAPDTTGTINQGYRGDNGTPTFNQWAGGGGGAGAVGTTDNGALGLNSLITGTLIGRAGGGAGGQWSSATRTGFDGGGNSPSGNGTSNTGGGGGGGGSTSQSESQLRAAGNGGSGVVILRMPTANYSGTTTGSPTVTTDGTDTILTYTGSGTYTA